MAIPQEVISEIIGRTDIIDIVSSYVSLKRNGRDAVGLCPFHNERTPSFHVSADKQVYHCFGCGAGGSVISFVMNIENLSYVDAIKSLADRAGVVIPEGEYDDSREKLKKRLIAANSEAGKFFYKSLISELGKEALSYLISRGITKGTIVKFGIGYAPNGWDNLLKHMKHLGFSEYELVSAGLLAENKEKKRIYDRFRNRVMFPIFDVRGNAVAFTGRVLDDSKPKYLNTNDTPVFDKSSTMFALNFARKSNSKRLIIVEGQMDVISLHQAGIDTAVASSGTAFTENHARLLKRYADETVLCFDSDEAGVKASKRALDILTKYDIKTRVLTLEGAKDPDEFVKKFGPDEFLRLADGAKSPLLYKIGKIKEKYSMDIPEQKISFLKEASAEIASLKSDIEREIYSKELSASYDIPYDVIKRQISSIRTNYIKNEERKDRIAVIRNLKQNSIVTNGSSKNIEDTEKKLLNLIFYDNGVYKFIKNSLAVSDFTNEFHRLVAEKINEFKKAGQKDIKESDFISCFPPEDAGKLAEILSIESHFDDKILGAEQLVEFLKKNLEKAEIGNDILKAKTFLEQKKQNGNSL